MRVATNGAADGAWRSGPPFQSRDTPVKRPPNQAIEADTAVRPDGVCVRTIDGTMPKPQYDTPHTAVADQHVGAAPQNGERNAQLTGEPHGRDHVIWAMGLNQPVGLPAGAKCRQRTKRHATSDPLGKRIAKPTGRAFITGGDKLAVCQGIRHWLNGMSRCC